MVLTSSLMMNTLVGMQVVSRFFSQNMEETREPEFGLKVEDFHVENNGINKIDNFYTDLFNNYTEGHTLLY